MLGPGERLVVGAVAESVIHNSHLNPLLRFLMEEMDKYGIDGVVPVVEILHVDEFFSFTNVFEEGLNRVVSCFHKTH